MLETREELRQASKHHPRQTCRHGCQEELPGRARPKRCRSDGTKVVAGERETCLLPTSGAHVRMALVFEGRCAQSIPHGAVLLGCTSEQLAVYEGVTEAVCMKDAACVKDG